MNIWISVKDLLPYQFLCLLRDDYATKNVVIDIINDKKGERDAFYGGMDLLKDGWKWDEEIDMPEKRVLSWIPDPEIEKTFIAEMKERYPDYYKKYIQEGGLS